MRIYERSDSKRLDLRQFEVNKAISQELIFTTASVNVGDTLAIDKTNFCNYAQINQIIIYGENSTNFEFRIFEEDDKNVKDKIYESVGNNVYMNDRPIKPLEYQDLDSSSELHASIKNVAGSASTFVIKIKYVKVPLTPDN